VVTQCTETVSVDQWQDNICFRPAIGDRGISGLHQYCNDTVTSMPMIQLGERWPEEHIKEHIEAIQYEASQYILSLPQGINISIRKLFTSAAAFSGTVLSQSAAGVEDLDGPGRDLYDKGLSACPGYIAANHHETRS
jgi:hypothetical protein